MPDGERRYDDDEGPQRPEDPLLLFSVLYGFWVANLVAFDGDVMRELAVQFLALADKQRATGPLMMGHRLMGLSLLHTGEIADGRVHLDRAITLYDPPEHRPLATRFGQDIGAATLSWKSLAFWLLGYPQAALADGEHALKVAREIGHSATLMYVLNFSAWTHILCGNYAAANALVDEFSGLKDQTGSLFWAAWGMRLLIGPDRQSLGRGSKDHLRRHRNAIDGNNDVDAVVAVIFDKSERENRSVR
jgi:predicted ATPase